MSSHSFIQVLNGKTSESIYLVFPLGKFNASERDFDIKIGDNHFTKNAINLNIERKKIRLKGKLDFANCIELERGIIWPGIMGPFSYLPNMDTYHGIVSMNHNISGQISINNYKLDFSGGKGYTEKDWGKQFPKSWIWMQSNHFNNERTSFMLSIAEIIWYKITFVGFLCAIWMNNDILKFSTYTGAKIKVLEELDDKVYLNIEDRRYILYIEAEGGTPGSLKSPESGEMKGRVAESITSKISLKIYDKNKEQTILRDKGRNAGLEIMDKTRKLKK